MTENKEDFKKRLVFRSWHRGTKEMDLILGSFANAYIEAFSDEELALYAELLHIPDVDLYNWISRREELPEEHQDNPVMTKLMDHHYASHRATGSDDR